MDSAFLVFDLIGGDAVFSASAIPDVSSIQNFTTLKKRSGLLAEKRVSRVPAGNASPKIRPGASG